jgi:hypothetical protein
MAQRQPNQAGGSQSTGSTAEAVQLVFNRTLPLALAVALALKQVKKPGDKNYFDVKR